MLRAPHPEPGVHGETSQATTLVLADCFFLGTRQSTTPTLLVSNHSSPAQGKSILPRSFPLPYGI